MSCKMALKTVWVLRLFSKSQQTSKNSKPDMPDNQFCLRMLHGGSDLQYTLINEKQNILCNQK